MIRRDLIIVGAGPAGLAAAIAAKQAGLDYVVLEKGALVNAILHFPTNMVFFTTPELLEIGGLPFITPYDKPTRPEALRYYRRVTDSYDLNIAFDESVLGIRPDEGGLAVETRSGRGVRRLNHARSVILATGTYDHPNKVEVPGEDLPHVSHYYREAHDYYRKRVVIVGGKNSAAETALELFRSGVHVTLVHRGARLGDGIKYWVLPDIENRIKEGSVEARFQTRVVEIRPTEIVLEHAGKTEAIAADAVFLLTGYHSDTALFARCGIRFNDVTCIPEHDPETLESNVPSLFVAGSVVSGIYGGKIFIENGRFHGEQVVATISQRLSEAPRSGDR